MRALMGRGSRQSQHWYSEMGRRVWFHEVFEFVFNGGRVKNGPSLRELMGPSLDDREYALDKTRPKDLVSPVVKLRLERPLVAERSRSSA
jgi:hypothetical protein